MPHLDVGEGIHVYYTVPTAPATGPWIDPSKETVVILPGIYLNIDYMITPHLEDARLTSTFNVIGIDLRGHGRSKGDPSPSYDHFVGAFDVARVLAFLGISSFHLIAPGAAPGAIACALMTIFPDALLSCAFVSVRNLHGVHERIDSFDEAHESRFDYPADEEDWMEGHEAVISVTWGQDSLVTQEQLEEVSAMYIRRHNPYQARRSLDAWWMTHRAIGLSEEEVASIRTPIIVLHGGADVISPPRIAQEFHDGFTGAKERSLHILDGGCVCISFTRKQEVNDLLFSFLSRHQTAASPPPPLSFDAALQRLAAHCRDSSVALRDPSLPSSFTSLTPDEIEEGARRLAHKATVEQTCTLMIPGFNTPEPWESEHGDSPGLLQSQSRPRATTLETQQRSTRSRSVIEVSVQVDRLSKVDDASRPASPITAAPASGRTSRAFEGHRLIGELGEEEPRAPWVSKATNDRRLDGVTVSLKDLAL